MGKFDSGAPSAVSVACYRDYLKVNVPCCIIFSIPWWCFRRLIYFQAKTGNTIEYILHCKCVLAAAAVLIEISSSDGYAGNDVY